MAADVLSGLLNYQGDIPLPYRKSLLSKWQLVSRNVAPYS
ncbi:Uncharacterised protein [Salmonella enterica subsp. arizonae]|nr:Uncharacterised protein [Salmonella enterica]SUG26591.1 Uncharacterised protein [Salmonella enterica subsp. arizonae]SUG40461.1 Uncharacterised protein [Salmonella enterica subsp. arizonae]SUG44840.1 Uncharacterised protein [Salmonella enterica subsp. arizonae]